MKYKKYLLAVSIKVENNRSYTTTYTKWGDEVVSDNQITKWEDLILNQFSDVDSGIVEVVVYDYEVVADLVVTKNKEEENDKSIFCV